MAACCGVSTIKNLLNTLANNVVSPTDIAEQRMEICRECDAFSTVNSKTHICKSCGCVCEWKTKILSQHCPQHKWAETTL